MKNFLIGFLYTSLMLGIGFMGGSFTFKLLEWNAHVGAILLVIIICLVGGVINYMS